MKSSCYYFQKKINSFGLLQNCVDATYVIHLENNGRYEDILDQLKEYQLSQIEYIVFNKGYLNCNKEKYIDTPPKDLVDTNLTIFEHANQHKYENILILEDDFIFNEEIKKKSVREEICSFINKKKEKNFIYFLGCIPTFIYPASMDWKHYRGFSLAMHACIFSKKCRMELLKIDKKKIMDWDGYLNCQFSTYRYIYHKPLCYQLIPDTENKKHWGSENIISYYFFMPLMKIIYKKLKLNDQTEPGYTYFYIFSKIIFWIFLIFVFFCLFFLISFFWNRL